MHNAVHSFCFTFSIPFYKQLQKLCTRNNNWLTEKIIHWIIRRPKLYLFIVKMPNNKRQSKNCYSVSVVSDGEVFFLLNVHQTWAKRLKFWSFSLKSDDCWTNALQQKKSEHLWFNAAEKCWVEKWFAQEIISIAYD